MTDFPKDPFGFETISLKHDAHSYLNQLTPATTTFLISLGIKIIQHQYCLFLRDDGFGTKIYS